MQPSQHHLCDYPNAYFVVSCRLEMCQCSQSFENVDWQWTKISLWQCIPLFTNQFVTDKRGMHMQYTPQIAPAQIASDVLKFP